MVHRRSIGRGRVSLGLTRVTTSGGRGVDGLSRVGHLGNIAIGVVGSVGDSLDPAVREGNSVRAANNTVGIPRFSSVEVCLGVVVRDTIGEGVWLRGLLGILHRGMICRCRCVVDRRQRWPVEGTYTSADTPDLLDSPPDITNPEYQPPYNVNNTNTV